MPHLHSSQVHLRGLVVIAVALAASQLVGMTSVHAQDASARTYDALAAGRFSSQAAKPSPNACDDGTGTGIGDTICGSMTGGPAGGNGS